MIEKTKLQLKESKLLSFAKQNVDGIVFFLIFYLYLWFVVDLRFVVNAGGIIAKFPVFYKGWSFFSEKCALPGGLVNYISSFFVQFFYFSWSGAMVVTLQAWLIYFFTIKFFESIKMSSFFRFSFIGPIIILVLYNNYLYFFNIASGFLVSLLFAYLYIKSRSDDKRRIFPLFVFPVLSILIYLISGGSILMFGLLCVIYELLCRARPFLAFVELVLIFAVVYIVGVQNYYLGIYEAFSILLPIDINFEISYLENSSIVFIGWIIYLFLPLISLILLIGSKIPFSHFRRLNSDSKFISDRADRQFLLLLIFASLVIYFTYDSKKKNFYAADYYANHRNWRKAIVSAECEIEQPLMLFIVNRALYNMDRFPQDMFFYPQKMISLFYAIIAPTGNFRGICQATDFCIDLGLIGHAEQFAWQEIENFGPHPELLERMATIRMVKGNMDSARVYLNKLTKTLFHNDWARKYLSKIDSDPSLANDEYIQKLRSYMLKNDHIIGSKEGNFNLIKLLEENRQNKMAFEYLMANYMLSMAPGRVIENLYRLKDFAYKKTPQAYEDAFFISSLYRGDVTVPVNFRVNKESQKRFNAFENFMRYYGRDQKAVEKEVMTNYKNTYYEYYFHGYKKNFDLIGGEK